jgi:hypothetical protein
MPTIRSKVGEEEGGRWAEEGPRDVYHHGRLGLSPIALL